MEIILFLFILLLFIGYCIFVEFDIINPGVIFLGTWVLGSFVAMIYSNIWGLAISIRTLMIIISGAFAFCLGISTILIIYRKKHNISKFIRVNTISNKNIDDSCIKISNRKINFIFVYLVISGFIMFFEVYKVSLEAGNSEGYLKMIEYARLGTTHYNLSLGKLTANLLRMNYALGVVLFYFFANGLFLEKLNKYRVKILLLAIFAVLLSIFSTGRTQFLGMVSAYLILLLFEYARYYAWKSNTYMKKVFKWIIIGFIVFILLFVASGTLALSRMGDSSITSIVDNIAIYIGSPITSLSYFIENREIYGQPSYFGENTFISIYGTLKSLGIVDYVANPFLIPIETHNLRTNVYTLYYHYIYDFGYISTLILQFVNGTIYGLLYCKIKYSEKQRIYTRFLYAILMYSLVMMFFQETLYSMINTHIIRFISAILIYNMIKIKIKIRL